MTIAGTAQADRFLTIALPLLPVFWILLALETTMLRAGFESAMRTWIRNSGQRRSRGNMRATLWTVAVTTCFATGGFAEVLALISILFGWQNLELISAYFMLGPLILSIGLTAWALLAIVGARVDER